MDSTQQSSRKLLKREYSQNEEDNISSTTGSSVCRGGTVIYKNLAQKLMLQLKPYPLETQNKTITEMAKILQNENPTKRINLASPISDNKHDQLQKRFPKIIKLYNKLGIDIFNLSTELDIAYDDQEDIRKKHSDNVTMRSMALLNLGIKKLLDNGMNDEQIHTKFRSALIECGRLDLSEKI